MSFTQTSIGIATISTMLITAIGAVLPSSQPAIVVSDISIYADGATNYDRHTVDGEQIAWSGQILTADGKPHCRGNGFEQYFNDENPLDTKDVNWLVSPDCIDGLEQNMLFAFTWYPLNPELAPVRYPAIGYGVVQPIEEKP